MHIFHTIDAIRAYLTNERTDRSIGLVPTMGALHQGHLKLIQEAKQNADIVVATIFVNPAQFNKAEDLEKYPVQTEKDLEMLKAENCDVAFLPKSKELYPIQPELTINFGAIENALEGEFRPGHFAGVGLIISKLYNIIQPTHAFFGQKDIQQFYVIKKLTEELNFPVRLHMVETMREESGLAMSSRNMRLNHEQKEEAALIFKCLTRAKNHLNEGMNISQVKAELISAFEQSPQLDLEYFEIVNTTDFSPLEKVTEPSQTALCLAAIINNVRLIDNLPLIS